MGRLEVLLRQYIQDTELLYEPDILVEKDLLYRKDSISSSRKETLSIIKSYFKDKKSFNVWWQENAQSKLDNIYNRDISWYTRFL